MKIYAVCPMSCDVACGHTEPDKVFGKFEYAENYVVEFYEYALAEHYTYERRLVNQGIRMCLINGDVSKCETCQCREPKSHTVTLTSTSAEL